MKIVHCLLLKPGPLQLRPQATTLGLTRNFHGPPKKDEFTQEAVYPEIPKFRSEHEAGYADLKKTMKNLKTVEEKQIHLNKPKYYGWYSCVMNTNSMPPSALDMVKYVTNTVISRELPENLKALDKLALDEAERLEESFKNQLVFDEVKLLAFQTENERDMYTQSRAVVEHSHNYKMQKINKRLQGIHRFLQTNLATRHSHLRNAQVDYDSRVEAFWMRSGISPDSKMVRKRKIQQSYRQNNNRPIQLTDDDVWKTHDSCFQIQGKMKSEIVTNLPIYVVTYFSTIFLHDYELIIPISF